MTTAKTVWKRRLRKFWREWAKPLLIVIIVLGSFRSAVADWNDVPTGSMKPTILEGERILVNKLAYGLRMPFTDWWITQWDGPQRGDVVICYAPDSGDRLVKRVVGLPGDVITLRDDTLIINGEPVGYEELTGDFADQIPADQRSQHVFAAEQLGDKLHPVMLTPGIPAKRFFGPVTLPPDQYFVMGDNRDQSRDSRFFGFVPRDEIVGRSSAIVLSFNPDRHYMPRWSRFFRSLP